MSSICVRGSISNKTKELLLQNKHRGIHTRSIKSKKPPPPRSTVYLTLRLFDCPRVAKSLAFPSPPVDSQESRLDEIAARV